MASNEVTLSKAHFLTFTDLVKKERSGELTQITPTHTAWKHGIECIKAYHMQATRLTPAQRDEMRSFIADVHYAVPPSAEGSPSSHKLYKSQHKLITEAPGSLSWPIFVILHTLYGTALPSRYVKAIRETFGSTVIEDHSQEYYSIEGTLPAGPVEVTGDKQKTTEKKASRQGKAESEEELAEKKKRRLAMLEEMMDEEEGDREQEDEEESIQPDDMQCGGLFSKTTQKRPASPAPLGREKRRASGDDSIFSRAAESILGNGSPAAKDIARSLLQEGQDGMGGRVGKAKNDVAAENDAAANDLAASVYYNIAQMKFEAEEEEATAIRLALAGAANIFTALKMSSKAQQKRVKAAKMDLEIATKWKASAEKSNGNEPSEDE